MHVNVFFLFCTFPTLVILNDDIAGRIEIIQLDERPEIGIEPDLPAGTRSRRSRDFRAGLGGVRKLISNS